MPFHDEHHGPHGPHNHDNGFMGNGGFWGYNHFENDRFFTRIKPSNNSSNFSFFKLLAIIFVGFTIVLGMIIFIIMLLS